jgi:hypothetical protein
MTRFDLANNYKIIIDTQYTINNDAAKALQTAWDMCMSMGTQHGFTDVVCHECWCKAIQSLERDADVPGNDN